MADAEGLDPTFAASIMALIAASGGAIWINSGYRSNERQAQLFNAAVQKYGSEAEARKWVAPPGHSRHNMGLAADLGGDMDLAHKLAPQYGLVFPMDWEPWHIEPYGARDKTATGEAAQAFTTPGQGATNTTDAPYGRADVQAYVFSQILKGEDPAAIEAQVTSTFAPAAANPANGETTVRNNGDGTYNAGNYGAGSLQSNANSQQVAEQFLQQGGFPVTGENVKAIMAWIQAEGVSSLGYNNPMNTTQEGFNSVGKVNDLGNGRGVQKYATMADGIAANLHALNNGRYGSIIDALRTGNSAQAVAQAVAGTPWGTGGLMLKVLGSDNSPQVQVSAPTGGGEAPSAPAPKPVKVTVPQKKPAYMRPH